MAVRSGRFKVDFTTAGGIRIIKGRSGAFYRVLNSGKDPFVVASGGLDLATLVEGASLDVAVDGEVKIKTGGAASVEGIYDYLDMSSPIRNGRFRIKAASEEHKIIHLNHTGKRKRAFYRIFNSGDDNPFNVLVDGDQYPYPGNPTRGLKPNQSFDFEVGKTNSNISVEAIGGTYAIEGIYEFLGAED
jgi:hypothetical protein